MKIFIVKIEADLPPSFEEVEGRFNSYYMGKRKKIEVLEIL